MTSRASLAACLGTALLAALPAVAQEWQGVVVGQSGADAPRAFADAFHVADALKAGGVNRIKLLRNQTQADVIQALDALSGAEHSVIYLTGPLTEGGAALMLEDGPLGFVEIITRVGAAGIKDLAILIEACPKQPLMLRPPAPVPGLPLLRAASNPPGEACTDGPRMTDLLTSDLARPRTLSEILAPVWLSSDLTTPLTLVPSPPPSAPVVSIVESDMVTLAPITSSEGAVAQVTLAALDTSSTTSVSDGMGEVVIFAPTPESQLAAVPTVAGLPEPSIIVGIIEQVDEAAFTPDEPLGEVSSNEISYENLDARRALRTEDPEQFASLVAAGAFDPPAQLLATALQTELSRMGCYTARIDGDWGRGSRASVERYFDEIDGVSAVTLDPTTDLFRQIMLQDDVECDVVAAASSARSSSSGTAARSNRSSTRSSSSGTTRRATTTRSTSQSNSTGRTIKKSNSLGVFR